MIHSVHLLNGSEERFLDNSWSFIFGFWGRRHGWQDRWQWILWILATSKFWDGSTLPNQSDQSKYRQCLPIFDEEVLLGPGVFQGVSYIKEWIKNDQKLDRSLSITNGLHCMRINRFWYLGQVTGKIDVVISGSYLAWATRDRFLKYIHS